MAAADDGSWLHTDSSVVQLLDCHLLQLHASVVSGAISEDVLLRALHDPGKHWKVVLDHLLGCMLRAAYPQAHEKLAAEISPSQILQACQQARSRTSKFPGQPLCSIWHSPPACNGHHVRLMTV